MRAPLLRYLAVIALAAAALVGSQAPAPAAAEPTASVSEADGCVDGAKSLQAHLTAADGADTTFTTIVTKNNEEVFRDSSRVVPAGTTEDLPIPGLTYGSNWIRVYADGEFILGDTVDVRCPPIGDYTNAWMTGTGGCDGETVVHFYNEPIDGAGGALLPVKFGVFDDTPDGTTTVATLTLPDDDAQPYKESVRFESGEYPKNLRVTANGEGIGFSGFAIPGCVEDPVYPVPETGY